MNKKEIIKQGVNLYNKHYPNDKHTTKKEKENFVKFFIDLHKVTNSNSNLANKTNKVLQSKVKTYEQDISNRPEIVYSKSVNFLKRNIKK